MVSIAQSHELINDWDLRMYALLYNGHYVPLKCGTTLSEVELLFQPRYVWLSGPSLDNSGTSIWNSLLAYFLLVDQSMIYHLGESEYSTTLFSRKL